MTVAFYLNIVSPHQLPLARAVARRVGGENFLYVHAEDFHAERTRMGWTDRADGVRVEKASAANRSFLEEADILYTGLRCLDLLERRAARGRASYYYSERWFKPLALPGCLGRGEWLIPGSVRMLVPRYRKMARGFANWLNADARARYLAVGPWAKKDMMSLGVRAEKIVDWGYFVEPGEAAPVHADKRRSDKSIRVLYVGRLIPLKRVETVIRAVARLASSSPGYSLTLVGDGPEEGRLRKLAASVLATGVCRFVPSVPMAEVRKIMRDHDVLVFSSNALDGWGAVVSEALAEGIPVIGTYETGASAALLPDAQLFHCGDFAELARKLSALQADRAPAPLASLPHDYTPSGAADRLLRL